MTIKVNTKTTVHRGRTFTVVTENVTLPNDITANFDIIRHRGAAAIIPFFDEDTILFLRQYRHALGTYIWEIPAGTLARNESPEECARRELAEETGYSSHTWHFLGDIIPVPGYSDEHISIFLATDLYPAETDLDSDEILSVHKLTVDNVRSMIERGDIQDGKTLCGFFMAMRRFEAGDHG